MRVQRLAMTFLLMASAVHADPGAAVETVTATVNGLVCDFCARSLEKTFARQPEVADVDVDLEARKVVIVMRPGSKLDDAAVRKGIVDAGFSVVSIARAKP